MPDRPSIVYLAQNRLTGDRYVGVTSQTLKRRVVQHVLRATRGNGSCRRFHAAIKEHGPAAFEWSVLAERASYPRSRAAAARAFGITCGRVVQIVLEGGQTKHGVTFREAAHA